MFVFINNNDIIIKMNSILVYKKHKYFYNPNSTIIKHLFQNIKRFCYKLPGCVNNKQLSNEISKLIGSFQDYKFQSILYNNGRKITIIYSQKKYKSYNTLKKNIYKCIHSLKIIKSYVLNILKYKNKFTFASMFINQMIRLIKVSEFILKNINQIKIYKTNINLFKKLFIF